VRKEKELRAVLMHRQQAQQAVDEQERKIAQLTALQADLRSRLASMTSGEEEVEEEEEEDEARTLMGPRTGPEHGTPPRGTPHSGTPRHQ